MLGPLGPAQIACLASWRQSGIRTHFLHTEPSPLPKALRRIADRYDHLGSLAPLDEARAAQIGAVLTAAGSDRLTCLSEQVTLRLWRFRSLLGPEVTLLTSPADVIVAMESKALQVNLARASGFDVLPTTLLTSAEQASAGGISYPLVLRPDRASLDPSFKAMFIHGADELERFFAGRAPGAPAVVAQRFIDGPNVVVHGSRSTSGELLGLSGYIVRLKNDGVSVTLEPWALPLSLSAACNAFAVRAGLVGVFHFDLLFDVATAGVWFLEVNARLGGTTAKVCASGYDEPKALLWAFGLSAPPTLALSTAVPVVNRLAALRCLIKAVRGSGSPVDHPFPSRRAVALRSLRAMFGFRDEVLRPLHPLGTLAFLSQYFR